MYNFAPLGYFTLSSEGEIIEINKSGSEILGKEGLNLRNSRLGFFVSGETRPIFNDFLYKVFNNKIKESCILNLSVKNNLPFIVHLTGIIAGNGEHCLVIISDITQRVQAEELHRIFETRYRRLFESAKDGILILDAETGMIVDVNPGIIRNLVSNAIKFTHPKGNITISANSAPDKSAVISIKDSGIGMNKEMLANLFRLEVNTNRTDTAGEYTTGLGLINCTDFVEKHGRKLWVESEEKIGSTFHFTLPGNIEPSVDPKH